MASAREFFEGLEERIDPSKTAGMTNSYVFEIDGAGTWRVDVVDGEVSVAEGDGDADATIATSASSSSAGSSVYGAPPKLSSPA